MYGIIISLLASIPAAPAPLPRAPRAADLRPVARSEVVGTWSWPKREGCGWLTLYADGRMEELDGGVVIHGAWR